MLVRNDSITGHEIGGEATIGLASLEVLWQCTSRGISIVPLKVLEASDDSCSWKLIALRLNSMTLFSCTMYERRSEDSIVEELLKSKQLDVASDY